MNDLSNPDLGGHAAARLTIHIRDVKVLQAIIVVITPRNPHGEAVRCRASFGRDVREAGRPVIAKQHAETPIAGDEEIWPSVLVVIAPGALQELRHSPTVLVSGASSKRPHRD